MQVNSGQNAGSATSQSPPFSAPITHCRRHKPCRFVRLSSEAVNSAQAGEIAAEFPGRARSPRWSSRVAHPLAGESVAHERKKRREEVGILLQLS